LRLKILEKLRTARLNSEFTGSYKKSVSRLLLDIGNSIRKDGNLTDYVIIEIHTKTNTLFITSKFRVETGCFYLFKDF